MQFLASNIQTAYFFYNLKCYYRYRQNKRVWEQTKNYKCKQTNVCMFSYLKKNINIQNQETKIINAYVRYYLLKLVTLLNLL